MKDGGNINPNFKIQILQNKSQNQMSKSPRTGCDFTPPAWRALFIIWLENRKKRVGLAVCCCPAIAKLTKSNRPNERYLFWILKLGFVLDFGF